MTQWLPVCNALVQLEPRRLRDELAVEVVHLDANLDPDLPTPDSQQTVQPSSPRAPHCSPSIVNALNKIVL